MNSYKDLLVWQKSIDLVVEIYHLTKLFPVEEKFCLVSQMRRSVVSITSNIAEGYARKNRRENAQFINIAYGSAVELETQIIISCKLNIINNNQWEKASSLLIEVQKMLYRYRETLYQ